MSRLGRALRLAAIKLPNLGLGMGRVPDAPLPMVRDLWAGDAVRGANLLRGELEFGGVTARLQPGGFATLDGAPALRAVAHGFSWLRDLRALGSDAARMHARGLVSEWISAPSLEALAMRPDVAGSRIAAWLGHYEFFAASADDGFRARFMQRMVEDARLLAAKIPTEERDVRALTALKGLIAAGVSLPDQPALLARALKMLPAEIARQVLPDGTHAERGPAQLMQALAELVEIRMCINAAQQPQPAGLSAAIDRMGPALRALRHPDGGLALFNGAREATQGSVDAVLTQAGRGGRIPSTMADGGFYRMAAGRAVLIADFGAPAAPGLDRFAHAGTLSFELSIGKDRVIVNCGGAPSASGEWRDASRATAAHSALVVADTSSAELLDNGLGRRPLSVVTKRQELEGEQWLEASHDGWMQPFGVLHHRELYIAANGEDIRGEDELVGQSPQAFTIRFHLHPMIGASLQQNGEAVLLRLPSGGFWQLRAKGARMSIEESIYLGGAIPRRCEQVLLTGYEDGEQLVKWAITKVEDKPR
jgi:uncharacterized heparinase superfamily protein